MAQPSLTYEPLWQVRFRLWRRGFAQNWRSFRESRIGPTGLVIIVVFGLMAIAHPILINTVWDRTIYDPVMGYDYNIAYHPAPPSWQHLLGTDPIGRDILSQLLYSTSAEFLLGMFSALVTVFIGTLVGTAAAYYEGFTDTFFMRLADIMMLFPLIPFLVAISAMMEMDLFKLAIILGLLGGFGGITVVLKSQALSIKVRPYIEAARVSGGSNFWIITKHIVPNVMPLSFLYMMFSVTGAIISEATLSFFGLMNIRISWGLMFHTAENAGYLLEFDKYWWLWLPAGLAITLFCAAFYLVGRGLDEVVNPRLRRR